MFVLKKIIAAFLMPVPIGIFLLLLALVFLLKNSYKKAMLIFYEQNNLHAFQRKEGLKAYKIKV